MSTSKDVPGPEEPIEFDAIRVGVAVAAAAVDAAVPEFVLVAVAWHNVRVKRLETAASNAHVRRPIL
jgi:hypothetical protein